MAGSTYDKLREQLESDFSWPSVYMFKFIVKADNHKIAQVEALFGAEAQIIIRQSRENKFTSITAKEVMMSPERVIAVYQKAELIEGIIAL